MRRARCLFHVAVASTFSRDACRFYSLFGDFCGYRFFPPPPLHLARPRLHQRQLSPKQYSLQPGLRWPDMVVKLVQHILHRGCAVTIGKREMRKSNAYTRSIKVLDPSKNERSAFQLCRKLGSPTHVLALKLEISVGENVACD